MDVISSEDCDNVISGSRVGMWTALPRRLFAVLASTVRGASLPYSTAVAAGDLPFYRSIELSDRMMRCAAVEVIGLLSDPCNRGLFEAANSSIADKIEDDVRQSYRYYFVGARSSPGAVCDGPSTSSTKLEAVSPKTSVS